MAETYVAPDFGPPFRVMVVAAATRGWYELSEADRDRYIPRMREILDHWEKLGARLLLSFDDDYFVVGEPTSAQASIYLFYEVGDLTIVPAMLQEVREESNGVRLDRCFRFEARVGRALFLARDAV